MTDHAKLRAARLRIAIGRARYAMAGDAPPTLGDLEDIISAAESWDRLADWKRGDAQPFAEWPEEPGWYLTCEPGKWPVWRRCELKPVACWVGGQATWWTAGSLPALPEPTDG